jgi:hypothetical protein
MILYLRKATVFAIVVASVLPVTGAQAQWSSSVTRSSPPLCPYAVQRDQHCAVEVAPNTHVIRRPAAARAYHDARAD